MPYTQTSFATLKQSLANRLDDPGKIFWIDTELGIAIQDAIRFWNILTGEFKQWYDLPVNGGGGGYGVGGFGLGGYGLGGINGVWYDFNTLAGSPRLCTLQDSDVYQRMKYALLESVTPTSQFQTSDYVQAVQRKRDEFLFRTGCTSSIETLSVMPNAPTLTLPEHVIQAKRAYWLPTSQASPTNPQPLPRTDEAQQMGYDYLSPVTNPTDPYSCSFGVEPQLTVTLYPRPGFPGQVELITYEAQAPLSAVSPTLIGIMQDFVPGLMWGAIADMMDMNMVAKDAQRAQYARMRFEQYIELMQAFPFVLAARNFGVPMMVDAVEVLDSYDPNWRVTSSTPSVVGLSGQNLLAFPTILNQLLGLYLVTNANVPVGDNEIVQLGSEVLDVILDYAAHVCMFKQGYAEVQSSMDMLKSIMDIAAHRNAKLKALASYKEIMYGREQREDEIAPMEVSVNG